jgi:acyl transferase domain-containing protein
MPQGVADEPLWQQHANALHADLSVSGARAGVLDTQRAAQFTAQVALGQVWRDYGVAPAAFFGIGSGALAAAYLAGALDARAALRILTQCAQDDCSLLAAAAEPYVAEAGQVPALRSLQAALQEQLGPAAQALLDRHEGLLVLELGTDAALAQAFAAGTISSAEDDAPLLLRRMAQLWQAGVPVSLGARYRNESRNRISLPPTPLQGERHWWQEKQ